MPTYLGIDYGTKRIGLALADELGIALPLGTIPGVDFTEWIEEMKKVVKDRRVDELVIGYPIHMDGVVGKRAKEVDTFISGLTENISLPVHRVDDMTVLAAINQKAKGKRGRDCRRAYRCDCSKPDSS